MYFMPNVWVLEFRCSQAGRKSLPMACHYGSWRFPPTLTVLEWSVLWQVMVTSAYHLVDIMPSGCGPPAPLRHPHSRLNSKMITPYTPFGHHHHYHPPPPPTNPGYTGADPGGPGKHVMCPLDPQGWVMCAPPPPQRLWLGWNQSGHVDD